MTKSGYSPQAAAELHKQLYRQKLQQLVAKKKLTADEQEELKRIRRILCIPTDAANQVRGDLAFVYIPWRGRACASCVWGLYGDVCVCCAWGAGAVRAVLLACV